MTKKEFFKRIKKSRFISEKDKEIFLREIDELSDELDLETEKINKEFVSLSKKVGTEKSIQIFTDFLAII